MSPAQKTDGKEESDLREEQVTPTVEEKREEGKEENKEVKEEKSGENGSTESWPGKSS